MDIFELINTKIGSKNISRFSNGNVYPVVARPFGMISFSIQTDNSLWFYDPRSNAFEGIRLTHQPSPWMGDYGQLLFLPITGEVNKYKDRRWSSYRPEKTRIEPYLMEGYLQRYRVNFRLTTSQRCAVINLKGSFDELVGLSIMPYEIGSFNVSGNKVEGYITTKTCWGEKKINEYFYIECDTNIKDVFKDSDGGITLYFDKSEANCYIASSFISIEQAKLNYLSEISGKSFDEVMELNKQDWLSYLSTIEVSMENEKRAKTFYSCFYRALLFPRIFFELDEDGVAYHWNEDTARVEKGLYYTDNGFWDTYRTVYPFLSIIKPDLVHDMIEGFVNFAEETGALPRWINPGEHGLMPGTLVEAVFADAAVKKIIDGELLNRCYQASLKSAYTVYDTKYQGRIGLEEYMRYGYITNGIKESVNNTCDCAYGDYCIAQMADLLNDQENKEKLLKRSLSYQNLFDPNTGFLRGKDKNGCFKKEFDSFEWGGENCEGSYWQNSFAVPHDLLGLAKLHGGNKKLEEKLDELFSQKPIFRVGAYENEIHEMSEMASVDFGQCAISNQPSFHIPYIYSVIGAREKTEYWVEKLCDEAFDYTDTGFPGDEDNGTMACWYIFSCLGFYPICPGRDEFVASKPLFNEIKINGKKITKALNNVFKLEL